MSSVLFLEVTDLIVKLLQLVLEAWNLIMSWWGRVFNAKDVFLTLVNEILLMLDARICLFNFWLQASDLVLRGLVRIVLSGTTLSQLVHLLALSKADLLCIMQLLLCKFKFASFPIVTQLRLLKLGGQVSPLGLFWIVFMAGWRQLREQLHLVVLFNSVQVS